MEVPSTCWNGGIDSRLIQVQTISLAKVLEAFKIPRHFRFFFSEADASLALQMLLHGSRNINRFSEDSDPCGDCIDLPGLLNPWTR